jgi:hypothetical protein
MMYLAFLWRHAEMGSMSAALSIDYEVGRRQGGFRERLRERLRERGSEGCTERC